MGVFLRRTAGAWAFSMSGTGGRLMRVSNSDAVAHYRSVVCMGGDRNNCLSVSHTSGELELANRVIKERWRSLLKTSPTIRYQR